MGEGNPFQFYMKCRQYNTVQRTVQYCTIQQGLQCYAIQHNIIQYNTKSSPVQSSPIEVNSIQSALVCYSTCFIHFVHLSLPVLVHLPRLVVVVFLVGHARCVVVLDKVFERYHHLQARGERGERRRQGKKGEEGGGEGRKGERREGKGSDGKGREMEGREGRSYQCDQIGRAHV